MAWSSSNWNALRISPIRSCVGNRLLKLTSTSFFNFWKIFFCLVCYRTSCVCCFWFFQVKSEEHTFTVASSFMKKDFLCFLYETNNHMFPSWNDHSASWASTFVALGLNRNVHVYTYISCRNIWLGNSSLTDLFPLQWDTVYTGGSG